MLFTLKPFSNVRFAFYTGTAVALLSIVHSALSHIVELPHAIVVLVGQYRALRELLLGWLPPIGLNDAQKDLITVLVFVSAIVATTQLERRRYRVRNVIGILSATVIPWSAAYLATFAILGPGFAPAVLAGTSLDPTPFQLLFVGTTWIGLVVAVALSVARWFKAAATFAGGLRYYDFQTRQSRWSIDLLDDGRRLIVLLALVPLILVLAVSTGWWIVITAGGSLGFPIQEEAVRSFLFGGPGRWMGMAESVTISLFLVRAWWMRFQDETWKYRTVLWSALASVLWNVLISALLLVLIVELSLRLFGPTE